MIVRLDPVTAKKLKQFGRRRRRLIFARGICSAIVSFLLFMSAIAMVDWLWVMSDTLRWTLSSVGYAATVVAVWITCLRLMIRIPNQRELARRMEMAEPGLRENLLSAIELCTDDPSQTHDSPVFRRLLQEQVGHQMVDLKVRSLLPLKLLGRWFVAAVLIVAVCGVLLRSPNLPYRQLMTRAILPGANIDRVARIHVTILQPTPHSLTLAQDETVAIVVEISGGEVNKVMLETHTASNGVSRHEMLARSPSQFVTNLSVGSDSIDYRILAGDAVTRKYTIRAYPRPSVQSFQKTFRFPEYTGLADKTITESHGDLVALEGTEVNLVLQLDQEVVQAELRLDRSGSEETETVELQPDEEGRLHVTLPIIDPGIYKVHLVAKETGFENIFSPKYEIRPEPDLIPRVGFVDLQDTTLLLPPNDVLALEGLAEDDLPLVDLVQCVSVNGRAWQKTPFHIDEARRVTATWEWDLLDLNLKSGDQVTTKLVATDRKGNTGESVPLNIVVSPPDFDPQRHAVMELKAELYDKLADLADTIEQHCDSAKSLIKQHQELAEPADLQDTDRSSLLDLADKVRDEADGVFKHIVEILPRIPAGADAYEVELAGRVVDRIQHEYMLAPDVYLDAASRSEDAKQAKEDLQRVLKSFEQTAEDAGRLEERYRDLLTHNVLAAIALDLNALLQHQRQLLAPGTPQSWQRLLRQETVAINQIRVLERLIRTNMPRLGSSTKSGMLRYLDWTRASRERLEAATESDDQEATLRKTAATLLRDLGGRQNADTMEGRLPSSILEARKDLDQRAGSLFQPLERLAHSAAEVGRHTGRAADSDESKESRQLLLVAERVASELQQLHVPSLTSLRSRRSVTLSRRDSDAQYAADAGLTMRALNALLDRFASEPPHQSEVPAILAEIAPAYRTLESGHEVVHVRALLTNLLSLERWNSQEITSRLDHPRQWDSLQANLELAARKLREARFPDEIASKVDSQRWSVPAQDAAKKITARRYRREAMVGAAHELVELNGELDVILGEIEPIMAEARALIAQYVPTIPEMAQRAAEQIRELEQQTTEVADNVSDSDDENVPLEMAELQKEQRLANERIEDLLDALVEDANAQDLLTEEGRERARDADDSTAMVQDPAARMNRAMQQAAAAERPEEKARDLAQAAELQQRTAQALDQVAEHYQRLESGEDVAETRNALRQAEREMRIARQMDQRYDPAQQLGEMAAKSPQQLLAELEAELQRNPPMQEALSEISRDALQQAKNSLEYSAEREEDMRRAIERSDQDFQAKKKAVVEELREIAQQATDLGRTLVAQADSAAERGKVQEARQRLREVQGDLREAAARPRSVADGNVLDDIVAAARDMAETLEDASENLAESRDLTAEARDESIHNTEADRANRQRELETAQRRFHDQRVREARGRARNLVNAEKQAGQRVRSAESSSRNVEKQVNQARQALDRDSDNQSAQRKLEQAKARQTQAQAVVDRAKQQLEDAKEKTEGARQIQQRLEKSKMQPLEAANPAAQLANRFAEEATEIAEDLTQRAKELAAEPNWADDLRPTPDQLTQAAASQQNVGEDVSQTAEDVARANRHEKRLGKPMISELLSKAADDIEQVAQGEVASSEQKLTEAAAEASSAEESGPDENQQALAASSSVVEAKEAISRQAAALDEILNPPEQPAAAAEQAQAAANQPGQANSDSTTSPQPSPAEAAEGELLARTLDELDRAVAAAEDSNNSPGSQQPSLPSLTQAAQAQAASIAQARMQSRMTAQNQALSEAAIQSADGTAIEDLAEPDISLMPVDRKESEDWGQLRAKSAEDLTEGRREAISAEYRKRVETYFRVIAERARKKK